MAQVSGGRESEAFQEYLNRRNLTGARLGAILAAVLVPSGVILDWLTNDAFVVEFMSLRLGASAACLLILAGTQASWALKYTYPLGLAPVLVSAVALEAMIVRLGGYSSPYYAGLMQLLLAVGILFYWRLGQILFACTIILLIWLLGPRAAGLGIDDNGLFFNNFYALAIGALIAIASNAGRYRAIRNEHAARFELAATSGELASALKRAQQVDQLKSEFFANVSHELRTPLTLILSPVDDLLERVGDSPERDALRVVRRNAGRLLRMIDDLLDLARLDAGGLRLKLMQVDVATLAQRTAENAMPAAKAKSIELVTSVEGEAPEIFGDPHRIEIILTNLIGNAMKFTPSGGRIEVNVVHNAAGTSVEVSDTGPGISRDEQPRIFDRFHQTETSERRKQGGVGIGLALARELAQLHGGSLTVSSELGEGSTFSLFLKSGRDHFHTEIVDRRQVQTELHPGRRAEDQRSGSAQFEDSAGVELTRESKTPEERVLLDRGRLPRVLVAEDEDDLRGFIIGVLERDYVIDAASNGAEALEMLQKNRPDLILTDVMMPEVSGLDLARTVKNDPALRQIPLILLTARGENEAALEGYGAGADDFVSKPFHTKVLEARIRAHLKMRGLSLQLADQARLASAGTLAAGLAHEVKNPLNAAINAARVLGSGGSSKVSDDKLVSLIIDALARIDSIITALDAHARPADGDDLSPCNVRKAVDSTLNLLEHKLRGRTEVHLECESTKDIFAPARAFNQVLLNLVDNAIRSGGANVWIEAREDNGIVSVSVADDGPGVPADVVHRIFDPFFTTRAEGEGTGLGLHLSRRIAQECGGELRYEPRPGGGARFVMEIPAMEQAA